MFKRLFIIIFGLVATIGLFTLLYRFIAFGADYTIPRISTLLAGFNGIEFKVQNFIDSAFGFMKLDLVIKEFQNNIREFVAVNNLYDVVVNIGIAIENVVIILDFILELIITLVSVVIEFLTSIIIDAVQFISIILLWITTNSGIPTDSIIPV